MKREKIGALTSVVGILTNIALALSKMVVGFLFGVISVSADGFNNLMDSFSSILSLVSFKISSKPADKDHPFGHARTEYVLAMVISFLILFVAFELIKESIGKIISPSMTTYSLFIIVVLLVSIVCKLFLFIFYLNVSKKIQSDVLKASAFDSLGDSISTFVILVTVIASKIISFNFDGYAGILVSLIIAFSGVKVLRETFSKIIGQAPDVEMVGNIKNLVLDYDGVIGIHDLNVHNYGPNKFYASVHIEVDSRIDVILSHELVDEIERKALEKYNIILTGHLDPVEVDNPEVDEIKSIVNDIIIKIDKSFSMHDFRIVKGHNFTNLIFDLAVPYENLMTNDEIINKLQEEIDKLEHKYYIVVTVEYQTI